MVKLTIAIPAYNAEKTIMQTIKSAIDQTYPNKEILIYDDGSTDRTIEVVSLFKSNPQIRWMCPGENKGIGVALEKLMMEAHGKYIVYLCADDVFADPNVCSDIVSQFDKGDPAVGVIGRYYYEFIDGLPGAVGVKRDRNIITSSCNPSGIAFRRMPGMRSTNKVFIEMPTIVANYIKAGWRWTMMEYDTIAVRIHPGGNTGTKKSYYVESPTESWRSLVGPDFVDYPMFVQLKNRAPKLLLKEILLTYKVNKKCLGDFSFWFYSIIALMVPGFVLRELSKFYRNRIGRANATIIKRGEVCRS